jgi:pimeloyl-ACP methyl ester carboxylesterase
MMGTSYKNHLYLVIRGLVICIVILGIVISIFGMTASVRAARSARVPSTANNSAPVIESTDCSSFKNAGLSGPNWQCGYLIVPENRQNPQSRTIKVAYALLKASGTNPQPDPVVYLAGGPGAAGIDNSWADWENSSLGNRDLILVDPRGVGYSQPEMKCPPETLPDASSQTRAPSAEATLALDLQWAQSCRDLLISQGFDLTAYNSLANANDLEDLRQGLGYSKWNLYGVSYGTRTALVSMREFPDGVRSVVLDSVLPPQVDRIGGDLTSTTGSLSALFSTCKANPACNRDYPDLETKFYKVVRKLDHDPIKITVPDGNTGKTKQVWITGAVVANGVREAMKRSWLVQIVPITINQIYAGDKDILEKLYPGLVSTENPAIYNTVLCHDVSALYDLSAFSANLEKHPELESLYTVYNDAPMCETWGAGRADPAENQPVQSDIPTLILNGSDYDSATPPAYAELAASTLSHSFLYEFQKSTHSVSFDDCPRAMMAGFLDNPSNAPDSSCMAHMKGLPFVTDVYVNPHIFQVATDLQFMPKKWVLITMSILALLFLSVVVVLPMIYLRSRNAGGALLNLARLALWIVAFSSLLFGGCLWLLLKKAMAETYGWVTLLGLSPASSRYLFILPWLIAVLTIGLALSALFACKSRWWGKAERAYFTTVTLAALCFTGFLIYWQILSF